MKNRGIAFWLLIVITFIGLGAAGRIVMKRAAYERANRTVQIAVDLPSLASLLPPGVDPASVTGRLKQIGITTYGVYEFKGKELLTNHDILAYRTWPEALASVGMKDPGNMVLTLQGRWLSPLVPNYLNAYFGADSCEPGGVCRIPDIGLTLETLTFGLHGAGIDGAIAPRFFNTAFENELTIKMKMAALDRLKPSVIVFDGETALGFPELLKVTAGEIWRRPGWSVGLVDMVEQDGVKKLAWMLPGRVIPVHSIPEKEIGKNPPAKALIRYQRAVKERGIRFLYVRLYTERFGKTGDEALEENIKYLEDLVKGLTDDGFIIGTAEPLQPFISKPVTRAACVAGAVAFAGLLLFIGFGFPGWLSLLGALGAFAVVFAFPQSGAAAGMAYKYVIKLTALGTACVVPGMSVAALFIVGRRLSETEYKPGAGEAAARWAGACALTLAGGIFTAAMLSQREYFLRMEVFSGVKIAFLMPLMLVFFVYLRETGEKLGEFFNSPLRYIEVAIGLVAVAGLAVYLIRSGNQSTPATAMTDQESALRTGLESMFYARPRFKEFLIGHPALLLVGLLPLGRKKYVGLLLILVGVIGQVSLFNSFCHLHTPIVMTYIRSVVGIMLGLVIGLGLRMAGTVVLELFPKKSA